jgi:DNA-binding response OmpR family regulator
VGVIIVTGKGETLDRIIGLEIGADDYLAKPFDLRELLARVRSVLRRTRGPARQEAGKVGTTVRFVGWQLDLASRRLVAPNGKEVALTTGELDLLEVFAQHPNRVLSRDQLLALTRHREAGPFDRSIDAQIGRLRRKIESDPERPVLIGWHEQVRTAEWLAKHPGPVVLSNQATDRITKLYLRLGYTLTPLTAPRLISCTGDRTPAEEVLATRNL